MPAAVALAACNSIKLCREMESERNRLRGSSAEFRRGLREMGLETSGYDSPICPVYFSSEDQVLRASSIYSNAVFFVPAIRPPTVPIGKSMLRISLSTVHTDSQLRDLLDAIGQLKI